MKLWCILVSLANPRPILRRALGWHLIKTTRFLEVRWILPGVHNGAPPETPGVAKIEAGGNDCSSGVGVFLSLGPRSSESAPSLPFVAVAQRDSERISLLS